MLCDVMHIACEVASVGKVALRHVVVVYIYISTSGIILPRGDKRTQVAQAFVNYNTPRRIIIVIDFVTFKFQIPSIKYLGLEIFRDNNFNCLIKVETFFFFFVIVYLFCCDSILFYYESMG